MPQGGAVMNYGRYQIVKEVGRGSMGVVYQARDPHIDRLVAVKVLRQDRVTSDDFVKRFLKEARVIGRLTHSHIVAIYDVGEEQETVYIAMEFLEGVALSDLVRGKLPEIGEVAALGIQLAETLDYAHQKGVVHRDIKPSNIIVQSDGQIKITDFGIAHVEDATATLQTQAGEIMGTPAYMSPEQVLSKPVDGRTDIFSLGIILYELTTGRRPFGGESKNLMTVFNEIVEVTPPEPHTLVPTVPRELSRLIMKALQKEPGKRFQTGKELAEALRGSPASTAPDAARGATTRAPGRNFLLPVGAALAAVAVLGGGYFLYARQKVSAGPAPVTAVSPNIPAPVASGAGRTEPPAPPTTAAIPPAVSAPVERPVPRAAEQSRKAAAPLTAPPVHSADRNRAKAERPKAGDGRKKPAATVPQPAGTAKESKPERKEKSPPEKGAKPAAQFAFLKVGTTPPGARVAINGVQKGTTPMMLKLDLGKYQVRLSRPGYKDVERQVRLEKMSEYPLIEELKPVE